MKKDWVYNFPIFNIFKGVNSPKLPNLYKPAKGINKTNRNTQDRNPMIAAITLFLIKLSGTFFLG